MESPYARFSREELEHMLMEYDGAICWDTNCLTCAKLYDKLYEKDVVIQKVNDLLESCWDLNDIRTDLEELIDPHIWGKA